MTALKNTAVAHSSKIATVIGLIGMALVFFDGASAIFYGLIYLLVMFNVGYFIDRWRMQIFAAQLEIDKMASYNRGREDIEEEMLAAELEDQMYEDEDEDDEDDS